MAQREYPGRVEVIELPNGDRYEGNFQKRQRHGYGTYKYANGDKYEGEWQNDEQSGSGTYYFSNGSKYDGEWLKGSPDG